MGSPVCVVAVTLPCGSACGAGRQSQNHRREVRSGVSTGAVEIALEVEADRALSLIGELAFGMPLDP